MALKPRYKRRIFWIFVSILAIFILAIIVVPPRINLNKMRPQIEEAIVAQTGIDAKINGDINFSMLGRTTVIAHDVVVPMGTIKHVVFSIGIADMFDIKKAKFDGNINIVGAHIRVEKIVPSEFNYNIGITNSVISFLDKDYEIARAKISDGRFVGTVRTNQHKYDIDFMGGEFIVKNYANNLEMKGMLFADGTARGHMSMRTPSVNRWFQFSTPKISGDMEIETDFEWDGGYGINLYGISANNINGNIEFGADGSRNVQLRADGIEYDFSFLLKPFAMMNNTKLDLDVYGKLKLGVREYSHLRIVADGAKSKINISEIIADDIHVSGGTIDDAGAHDIMVVAPLNNNQSWCLFSGTRTHWTCRDFAYGDMRGTARVTNGEFDISVRGSGAMPSDADFAWVWRRMGTRGRIEFVFSDMAGTFDVNGDKIKRSYTFVRGKTLRWVGAEFNFLPKFMMNAVGDFLWDGDSVNFRPASGGWQITFNKNYFYLSGDDFHDMLQDVDLQSMKKLDYVAYGGYSRGAISDLVIKIADHTFTGSASGRHITLKTDLLNMDSFVNQKYIDKYDELEFLTAHPMTLPFDLPVDISLSADRLIYNGDEYQNFVYALKSGVQTLSITDAARGNMLAIIKKHKTNYDISLDLANFKTNGKLLSSTMPLNISDVALTGEIELQTSGQIAHDIIYNMAGTMDLSFDGGYIIGIGIDDFYAKSANITSLNAEYALSDAIGGGKSRIKKMRIIGEYNNGDFKTTRPLQLSLRHSDIVGNIEIVSSQMQGAFSMLLRGTSPTPHPMEFSILPDGTRRYSAEQVMNDFDAAFLREFVKTHDRF